MSQDRASPESHTAHWMRVWLAESVRLREAHWGPLDDGHAIRVAQQAKPDVSERVLVRARILGEASGLADALQRWRRGGWLAFALLALLAVFVGAGTAAGALGDGSRVVNVVWALAALLGVHAITFCLWLATLFLPQAKGAHGLGALWLWMMRKVARGPHATLIPSAFINILAQAGIRRSFFGVIVHTLWSVLLGAALVTLILLLSTAQYEFVWATTLLAPERFVALTHSLGSIPAWLGFPVPDADLVRASDGRSALPAQAQVQWSLWLLGVLIVYGVLPRLAALSWCLWRVTRALPTLTLDLSLPGIVQLRERLQPLAEPLGIDRPVGPMHQPTVPGGPRPGIALTGGQHAIVALEPAPNQSWPPFELPPQTIDLGSLDNRDQRRAALDALAAHPAAKLLVVCDSAQTPDRGAIGLITDLARYTTELAVWVPAEGARASLWRTQLEHAGLPPDTLLPTQAHSLDWLTAAP